MYDEFVAYLQARDRSETTIKGYLTDLRSFAVWFEKTNGESLSPRGVTPLDLRGYRAHLVNVKKQAGATVNRKLPALRMWLAWAQENSALPKNEATAWPSSWALSGPSCAEVRPSPTTTA